MKQKRIDMVERYVDEFDSTDGGTGMAGEAAYYQALGKLIKNLGGDSVHVIIEPVMRKGIRPDFAVSAKNGGTTGYIEAKAPGSDLDNKATNDQVRKYLDDVPNVILTNYKEFRLYRGSGNYTAVYLDYDEDDLVLPCLLYEELVGMIDRFLSKSVSVESDICRIAELLAGIARDELRPAIYDRIDKELDDCIDSNYSDVGELLQVKMSFDKHLNSVSSRAEFANMYAQTIAYGLLDAKINHSGTDNDFNRDTAIRDIPRSFDMLHTLFKFIATDTPQSDIDDAIERIVGILNETNPAMVMERYYNEGRGKKWFEHFYETFLSIYDPEERKRMGAYYTPDQVVLYIIRSLDRILKNSFDKDLGFADDSVAVLDPAVGTMTFLATAQQMAIDTKVAADGNGMIDYFIRDHIMKHFHGYEVKMVPYVLSHIKMGALLNKNGYTFPVDKSCVYLANTLDLGRCSRDGGEQTTFDSDVDKAINGERKRACMVHLKEKTIAIIGNPPYSGVTANKGMFDEEMNLYKDSVRSETAIRALSDDYVKFIRFAHKRICDQGEGVIGYVTNRSYLVGLNHRGMREELMKSFDEIYILDLHGDTRNSIPGDEGVFDITVGTAIAIFVKTSDSEDCKVYYSDLVGSKESKFDYLNANSIDTTEWQELEPCEPYYFFDQKDFSAHVSYDKFVSMADMFKEKSSGVATARDELVIRKTKSDVHDVMNDFAYMGVEHARNKYDLGEDKTGWKVYSAQEDVIKSGLDDDLIKRILYRVFDIRHTYYTGNSNGIMTRPGRNIMQHMMRDNLGLLVCRQHGKDSFRHVYVCDTISDINSVASQTSICPLYLYSDKGVKKSNIKAHIFRTLSSAYGVEPTPEDIFYYIYGILHSNIYREKYAEFLKIDFPKVPFTDDHDLFVNVGEIGKKLADLHLMKPDVFKTDAGSFKYLGHGDNVVGTPNYDDDNMQVMINNVNYFDGVDKDVWEYHIGGHRPAESWLKDRKGDALTWDDVNHYRCICNALEATIELQVELDGLYGDVESGEVLNFDTRKDSDISEY